MARREGTTTFRSKCRVLRFSATRASWGQTEPLPRTRASPFRLVPARGPLAAGTFSVSRPCPLCAGVM